MKKKVAKVANNCMKVAEENAAKEEEEEEVRGIDVSYRPENCGLRSLEECIFQSEEH